MFGDAFSAAWLMAGYLILLVMLGLIAERIGKMKSIKATPGWLGGALWLLAVYIYYNLASKDLTGPLLLIAILVIFPLIYIINIAAMLLSKAYKWQLAADKPKALRYLLIFLGALAVWVIGLILA